MELLILIALFWLALWRGRRWYARQQQPPVTVNVVVDGRSVNLEVPERERLR